MKKNIFVFAALLFLAFQAAAQADKVVGFWLTEEKDAQVQIVKAADGKYDGAIVWLDEPNEDNGTQKIDDENPDPALQKRPILGLQLLNDFIYNSKDKEWQDGKIYDPDSGNTYDCYMWFDEDGNILKIKGFILGMRFIGRTSEWYRDNGLRN